MNYCRTNLSSHDLRLNVYFQNKRIREHLIRAGLVNIFKSNNMLLFYFVRFNRSIEMELYLQLQQKINKKDVNQKYHRRLLISKNTKRFVFTLKIKDILFSMADEERKRRRFLQNYFDFAMKRDRIQKLRVCFDFI